MVEELNTIPAIVSNLTFEVDGREIPSDRILRLLNEMVPGQHKACIDKRSLALKLEAAGFTEKEYFDLCSQEHFKRLLFDFAYFKILFPKIPAMLDLMAQAIDVGKESYLKSITQLLAAYHPQLAPAPTVLEKHEHLHLQSMTPDQLKEDLNRLNDEVKQLVVKVK